MSAALAARAALLTALLGALPGCVTPAPPPPPPRPLPDGVYQHRVTVWSERGGTQQFHGVLKLASGTLNLVLLSAFDTTMVRIVDRVGADPAPPPRIEAYVPELATRAGEIERLYVGLKPALVDTGVAQVEVFGRTADVTHRGSVATGVPQATTIAGTGFRITVEVSAYAPAPPF